ncbi:MAG TPA: VOC family protein [Acidimicrobiia bacterium]
MAAAFSASSRATAHGRSVCSGATHSSGRSCGTRASRSPSSRDGAARRSHGSWHVASKNGRNRQEFDLAAPEPAVEAERLVALGATVLGDRDDGVGMADPDGNGFSITLGH